MPTKLFTNVFFSEQNFYVTNYSSVISSIAFSKCTKFFNNCLIERALIITKPRAKLKVILSENYCKFFSWQGKRTRRGEKTDLLDPLKESPVI